MKTVLLSRALPLLVAVTLVALVACVESPTSPRPAGRRSFRDTTFIEGDTTLCRAGWIIQSGRYVCKIDQ